MNNDVYQSIVSLSRGYEDGSTTPSSVLDRCLNRISLLEPRLGAFEVVYEEEAVSYTHLTLPTILLV